MKRTIFALSMLFGALSVVLAFIGGFLLVVSLIKKVIKVERAARAIVRNCALAVTLEK